jgi:YD repeat-containing protein
MGNETTQTDALGRTTTFWTDSMGHRTKRILPKDSGESSTLTETLHYDEWGNLDQRTDFAGYTTTFGYDTLNRLTSKTADASHPSLTYSNAIARIEYDYDADGPA